MTHDTIQAKRDELLEALRQTFDSAHGKLALGWLHATAATRKPAFIPGKHDTLDPLAAAFRDGRKSILWEIEANLELARRSYGDPNPSDKPKTRTGTRRRSQGA